MLEKTAVCPICHHPYTVHGHFSGDQSACPGCRAEVERLKEEGAKIDRRGLVRRFFGILGRLS